MNRQEAEIHFKKELVESEQELDSLIKDMYQNRVNRRGIYDAMNDYFTNLNQTQNETEIKEEKKN